MNTVLTLGASGFLGSHLFHEFEKGWRVVGTYHQHPVEGLHPLDVAEPSSVGTLLDQVQPTVILFAAAIPNVDSCELYPAETWQVNVEGLRRLLEAIYRTRAHLVYFSSEYVFDGRDGPYDEEASVNPINEYGRQKLACEHLIQERLAHYLIARVSGLYGWEARPKNFVVRLIASLRAGQPVQVPSDQVTTPTFVPDLARAMRALIELGVTGIYHVAGEEPLVRYKFAEKVAGVFSLDAKLLVPVSSVALGQAAPRPLNAGMRTEKVQEVLGRRLMRPLEGLNAMRKQEVAHVPL